MNQEFLLQKLPESLITNPQLKWMTLTKINNRMACIINRPFLCFYGS